MSDARAPILIGVVVAFALLALVTGAVVFWGAWLIVAIGIVLAVTRRSSKQLVEKDGETRKAATASDLLFVVAYGVLGLVFAVYLLHEVNKIPH